MLLNMHYITEQSLPQEEAFINSTKKETFMKMLPVSDEISEPVLILQQVA